LVSSSGSGGSSIAELSQSDRISVAVLCAGVSQRLRGRVSEASQGNRRGGAKARAVVEASAKAIVAPLRHRGRVAEQLQRGGCADMCQRRRRDIAEAAPRPKQS
jgi:hypothetical protein